VGRPNVGKSTLMNAIIGEKIAIMSDRPQTTRNRITGIYTEEGAQIVFLDTPGIHKPLHKLGEVMNQTAEDTFSKVDAVAFLVDASEKKGAGDSHIISLLKKTKTPVILVINKTDKIQEKEKLLSIIASYRHEMDFAAVVPLSALEEDGIDAFLAEVKKFIPEGPAMFPEDEITDQPMRSIAAEMIREKVLKNTRDEVPHAVAVEVDEFKDRPNGNVFIRATIYVERESQKGIVIGSRGQMLKKIGREARADIENLAGTSVYLDLWVKVRGDWRNKPKFLKAFGYKSEGGDGQ